MDSAFDFDRLRRKQYGARVPGALRHRRTRSTLPVLNEVTREPRQLRDAGEQLIPVASIVGSVDGASQLFDRNFRPVSDRARARLGSVLVAMRQVAIPAYRGVGMARRVLRSRRPSSGRSSRALGSDYISAHVIEVVELSRFDAKAVRV